MSFVTHTMQIFFTLLVPVVCLGIVYFLGRIKPIGRFYAVLLIPPGKLFSALADFLSPFDVKHKKSESKYPGLRTIVLLIALCFAVVALAADGYNTLQAVQAIWTDANFSPPNLPPFFTYSMGWLFLSLPILTGMIWLEQKKAVEKEVQIFTVPQEFQKKFERFIFTTFVLSLLASLAFNALKPAYTADNTSLITQVLQICVFVTLGALLPLIMALVLYILALALQAVGSLLLTILCFVSSLLADLTDFLVLEFTRYERSIKDTQIGVRVIDRSSTVRVIPEQQSHALLPQHASTMVDAVGEIVVPVETQEMENVPMNLEKNASVNCIGSFGAQMFPLVAHFIQEFRATGSIKSSSFLVLPINDRQTAIPGVVDMTPKLPKRHAVALHSDTQGQAYKKLMDDLGDTIIEVHGDLKAVPAPIIFVIDCHELIEAVDMLESTKRRYPLSSIVVLTEVSPHDFQDKSVQVGFADLQALVADDTVEVVMVSHTNSALASAFGLATAHRFLAHLLVSLVVANTHSHTNSAFVDVLCSLSSFVTTASASAPVAVGKLPKRLSWVPFVKGRAGTGSYADILAQSRVVIDKVLNDVETSMFPVSGDPGSPRVVVVSEPVRLDHAWFEAIAQENALYTSQHYPNSTCITVKGNGIAPLHYIGSRFLVTASCLTPIPNPASLFRAPIDTSVKVTQLHPFPATPEPSSTNSHVPALPKHVAKAAKAVTTTRRVSRKNTRQAK